MVVTSLLFFCFVLPLLIHSPLYSLLLFELRSESAEPIENRWFVRVPTAEKLKNLKTDCGFATSKKLRIAGLSERPGGVSAVGSLSCTKIERAILRGVRQIAGAKFSQNRLNGGLTLWLCLLPYPSCKAAQIASQAVTRRSLSFSARGAGFPQKRCGR